MFNRILVPLDGSRFAEAALPHALTFARRWEAGLQIVIVAAPEVQSRDLGVPDLVPPSGLQLAREQARQYLQGTEKRIREAGFRGELTRKVIPAGNIWRGILAYLLDTGVDLVMMTTHGLGPLRRAWLGSTADALIRHSPVPLFLVRPPATRDGATAMGGPDELSVSVPAPRRIFFPLDGSKEGERMLTIAKPFASEDTECLLLRAVAPFIPGGSPYLPHLVRDLEVEEQLRRVASAYLERVSDRCPCGKVSTQVVTAAQAAVAILSAAAAKDADLIAISTAGRGRAGRLLMGSVADKVVRGSPVPVLIVRTGVNEENGSS
jgi:nucleotide-binding universal stress UspA family protein